MCPLYTLIFVQIMLLGLRADVTEVAGWPNWIRRHPPEVKIAGSSPALVDIILFYIVP